MDARRYRYFIKLEAVRILEQADAQVVGKIDVLAIAGHTAIGDPHDEFALDNAL
jgi:hypothetical protein